VSTLGSSTCFAPLQSPPSLFEAVSTHNLVPKRLEQNLVPLY
jgi:hypothetical protein